MNARTIVLGGGTAVTTVLFVGAATIELLGGGEAPGIGILGVFVGLLAGLLAGGVVVVAGDRLGGLAASALVAYATFGVAVVAIAGLRYVNVPYADAVFSVPVHLGVSVLAAVVVALVAHRERADRRTPAPER